MRKIVFFITCNNILLILLFLVELLIYEVRARFGYAYINFLSFGFVSHFELKSNKIIKSVPLASLTNLHTVRLIECDKTSERIHPEFHYVPGLSLIS